MQDAPAQPDPFALLLDLGPGKAARQLFIETPEIQPINAIQTELETFLDSVIHNTEPLVTIMDGYASLELAYQIMEKIEGNPVSYNMV